MLAGPLVVIAAGIGLMAFSPASVLNAFAICDKYRLTAGIPYGESARHTLDIYVPTPHREAAPVVVFFYGGNWQHGEKATYRFLGAALAGRGFLTIVPDYRVYPEVNFPGFLEDAASAVRWAHDHAAEYGGDPDRLVLMGHSAGAHIAAMLTYDGQWLGSVGLDPNRDVKGLVGLAGPYDFLPLRNPTLKIIFGPEDARAATQPINFVETGAPPAFLATGAGDDTVRPGNTARLGARIAEKGATATVRFYDRIGHRILIGAFAVPLRSMLPVWGDTVGFIETVTRASSPGVARSSPKAAR